MQFTIDADHPALPGHFPGHPVVPGVVILSYVFAALSELAPRIGGIRRLKFLQPVLPGQTLRLEVAKPEPERVGFKCWSGEVLMVEGQIALKAKIPSAPGH